MKKNWNYYKIKWTVFFTTVSILTLGLTVLWMMRPQKETAAPSENVPEVKQEIANSHYSNVAFGKLIEEHLSDLTFITNVEFSGESEGHFSIKGILTDPKQLTLACPDLSPYSVILDILKNKSVTINGHIGEDDKGNGCFVADTIHFSDQKLPAGIATTYIEEYTTLNELLAVPVEQIALDQEGITFEELPTAIQIASYR